MQGEKMRHNFFLSHCPRVIFIYLVINTKCANVNRKWKEHLLFPSQAFFYFLDHCAKRIHQKVLAAFVCSNGKKRERRKSPMYVCFLAGEKKKRKMKLKFTFANLLTLLPPRNGIEQFVFVWCFDGF